MSEIRVEGVSKRYGARLAVVAADLTLTPGRITCLLGPSGCGKSTLLRLIAGLETADGGTIRAGERVLSGPGGQVPPEKRSIGLVFQDYALFPHLRAGENVAFGLKALPRAERKARALAGLERVKLAARADAWPHELSGGEQQRVALARALAREPEAILLDEPFSGLDAHLKGEVRETLLAALRAAGAAVLIVTHDAEEALLMADDLALMSEGRILQTGTPEACYLKPVSMTAARLLGPVNAVAARVVGGRAETAFGVLDAPGLADGAATAMIRPEGLRMDAKGVAADVTEVRFGGAFHEVSLAAGGQTARMVSRGDPPKPGEPVTVSVDPSRAAVFAG